MYCFCNNGNKSIKKTFLPRNRENRVSSEKRGWYKDVYQPQNWKMNSFVESETQIGNGKEILGKQQC